MTDVGPERGCVSSDRGVYLPDISNGSNTTFTHITYSSPPAVELFTIPGWFMLFWMSAGKNLPWNSSLLFLLLFDGSRCPTTRLAFRFWCHNCGPHRPCYFSYLLGSVLDTFVFLSAALNEWSYKIVPIQPVTLPFFPALGLPVLLRWIRLTLELGARGHISSTQTHQQIRRHCRDKGTLKYAFLSQPWYLWLQHSNPLPQTPTLEGICGCLINTNRNKAWSLCPHLLYVFPAIKWAAVEYVPRCSTSFRLNNLKLRDLRKHYQSPSQALRSEDGSASRPFSPPAFTRFRFSVAIPPVLCRLIWITSFLASGSSWYPPATASEFWGA